MQTNVSSVAVPVLPTSKNTPAISQTVLPVFARVSEIQRLFGLRKGTLYNLINGNRIQSVLLPVMGKKSGIRLIEVESVRRFIYSQMPSARPLKGVSHEQEATR